MREILFNLFDSVMCTEDTPEQWNTGVISSLYKGGGDREDMINMRGINVSSNVGKVFERIINNRLIKVLPFTEAQAGGRKEYSTVDQLFILKWIYGSQSSKKISIYYVSVPNVRYFSKTTINVQKIFLGPPKGSGSMLPQKILKMKVLKLAKIAFIQHFIGNLCLDNNVSMGHLTNFKFLH